MTIEGNLRYSLQFVGFHSFVFWEKKCISTRKLLSTSSTVLQSSQQRIHSTFGDDFHSWRESASGPIHRAVEDRSNPCNVRLRPQNQSRGYLFVDRGLLEWEDLLILTWSVEFEPLRSEIKWKYSFMGKDEVKVRKKGTSDSRGWTIVSLLNLISTKLERVRRLALYSDKMKKEERRETMYVDFW